MPGAVPNGGVLAVQDPYKQQKSNYFRSKDGEKKNPTRIKIYAISEELGLRADALVRRRKTSFIQIFADRARREDWKSRTPDERAASPKKILDDADYMIEKGNTVFLNRPNGEIAQMTVEAFKKMANQEDEISHRTRNTSKLDKFMNGEESSSSSNSSSSNSSSIGNKQNTTGKKRKRQEEEDEGEEVETGKKTTTKKKA